MYSNELAIQILDLSARRWPYYVENMDDLLGNMSPATGCIPDVLTTLAALCKEDYICFYVPLRVEQQLKSFQGFRITDNGRKGREHLAEYDQELEKRIIRVLAAFYPKHLSFEQLVEEVPAGNSIEEWMKIMLALELKQQVELKSTIRGQIDHIKSFAEVGATNVGKYIGDAIPKDVGGFF